MKLKSTGLPWSYSPKDFESLEHAKTLRATGSIASAIANADNDSVVEMAADRWRLSTAFTTSRTVTIRGREHATTVEVSAMATSPAITIDKDNFVIDGVRFVGDGTAPVTCIKITGDDVTIRNCTFDGFATTLLVDGAARFIVEGCRFLNQSVGAIDVDNGDYGVIVGNHIKTNGSGNEIDLDSNSQKNVVTGNNASDGAISIATSGGQLNKYAGNQPTVTTT